jgi:acetate kinase
LATLGAAEELLPDVPHVAVFDTTFHATLTPDAYTYPVPHKWTDQWGIRRFGFHGLSHAYCARRAAEMLGQGADDARFVICHLGHGCSVAAVRGRRCVDTTMGFTPLDGLMMATRSGSIDPGIVLHVQQHHGVTVEEVEASLNRKSGLLGVSGVAGDMRQVCAAAAAGNERACLAIAMYTRRVRQAIGAFTVTLGGVDALVFTAGVGENSSEIRKDICTGLECLGLRLSRAANETCKPDADISSDNSQGRILVIATREDITMLREIVKVLAGKSVP